MSMSLREDRSGTERERTENGTQFADHLLSTDENEWSDLDDGAVGTRRFHCNEPQLQRREDYRGWLDEWEIPEDELRALFAEMADYFGVFSYWHFVLPCAGLPGKSTETYERDEEAAELLRLGMDYAGAIIANERRTMHNRWQSARDLITKIEERADHRVRVADVQARMREDERRQEDIANQLVYFIGASSGPIKIGIAVRPQSRLAGLQTGHHEKLELLATCEGGARQERAYHKQFADRRLNGEWFERCPEILAEIELLTHPRSSDDRVP